MGRFVRVSVVVALVVAGATASTHPAGAAGPPPSDTYLACGRANVASPGAPPTTCPSLSAALTSAMNKNSPVTIEMMPGDYCPPDLSDIKDNWSGKVTFVGAGFAALGSGGPPQAFTGVESEATAFAWDSTCTGSAPTAFVTLASPSASNKFAFRNLAFIGGGSGPSTGLSDNSTELTLRDVTFKGLSTGLFFNGEGLSVESSTFANNSVAGMQFDGSGSVDQSTFAGNGVGISASNFTSFHLGNDTISHNGTGFTVSNNGNTSQVANTINAGNAVNCAGITADWANASFNPTNLVGAGCNAGPTDRVWNGTAIAALAANGGPTRTITPPAQARNSGTAGACNGTTVGSGVALDQREYIETGTTCDIGAVDLASNGTPSASASPDAGATIDFGETTAGHPGFGSVSVYNAGGALLFGYDVSVSSTGFAVTSDGCSHAVMVDAQGFNGCFVVLTSNPTHTGQLLHGTLTIHTSAKTLSYRLRAGPPLLAPTNVHGTAGGARVDLAWTAPSNGGPAVAKYLIQKSTDNGVHWSNAGSTDKTTATVAGLTDGTSYVFQVRSTDTDGDISDWSAKSAAVVPVADASALAIGPGAKIAYGKGAKLTATLTDTTSHTAVSGATLILLSRIGTSGAFHPLATAHTDVHGQAVVTAHPKVNTRYQWTYAATPAHHAATSAVASVHVAQVVRASLQHASVTHGQAATIYGTVSPAVSGEKVTVQMRSSGHWVKKGSATIHRQKLPNGHRATGFVFSLTLPAKGSHLLRVSAPATKTNSAAFSRQLTLHVT